MGVTHESQCGASHGRLSRAHRGPLDPFPTAACGIDRRHRVVYWNDCADRFLGWTAREALGRPCYDVFAGQDVFGNLCCFRDCGIALGPLRGEAPGTVRDGRPAARRHSQRLVTRTLAFPSPGAAYRSSSTCSRTGTRSFSRPSSARPRGRRANRPDAPAGPPEPSDQPVPARKADPGSPRAGYGSVNIAARLGLSHATIRNHVQHLLRRMDVHSQVEAVSLAFRRGLLGRDEDGGDGRIRTDE